MIAKTPEPPYYAVIFTSVRTEGDLGRACQMHADSLHARLAFGEMIGVYDDLVGLAATARAMGRSDAAARLLGAEESFRISFGYEGYGVTPELREETRHRRWRPDVPSW